MGKFSRDKGARFERALVKILQDRGICAERIPLSGMGADRRGSARFKGDVSVPVLGTDQRFEAKSRATGFAQIYEWLGDNYGLFIKADRKEVLVVMRLSDAAAVLDKAEAARVEATKEGQ